MEDALIQDMDYINALMHLNLIERPVSVKLNDDLEYYGLIKEVCDSIRELESGYITQYQEEIWGIAKNLLIAFEQLKSLGLEQLDAGNTTEAYDLFHKSCALHTLFCKLNQQITSIKQPGIKDQKVIKQHSKRKKGIVGKLGVLVQKVIDCCIE